MALTRYRDVFWRPDESPAAGVLCHVFPRFSNTHASLFTDGTGLTPLANPVTSSVLGVVEFWAENGDYWLHLSGLTFPAILETDPTLDPVWPSTYRWDQAVASTVWNIVHGLQSRPSVEVLIGSQLIQSPQVDHVDENELNITFASPLSGTAYLRR